jgi:oligo-1,6-glucosidase
MVYGKYDLIAADDPEIYAYTRTLEDEIWLVVCNFFGNNPDLDEPSELAGKQAELVIGNYSVDERDVASLTHLTLRPYECRVYRLS